MTEIHPAAHLDSGASIGEGVRVGVGAVIGPGVRLGEGCEVGPYAVVEGPAVIGSSCRIFPGAVIGVEAQMVTLKGKGGGVEIGPRTVIREMATVHRSIYEGQVTRLGGECYLMVGAHVAHDCVLGDHVIMTNGVTLGGHVEIGNDCFLSNAIGVHQFVRLGEGVMIIGPSAVRKDVPPFTIVDGLSPKVRGLNIVGLRRRGKSAEVRENLKRAYRILFQRARTMSEGIALIEAELPLGPEIQTVIEFVQSSKRGIYQGEV